VRAVLLNSRRDSRFSGAAAAAHCNERTRALYVVARERGLLSTASAGFHGPGRERFNGFGAFELYGLEPNLGRVGA
jgi:hypothetical protein